MRHQLRIIPQLTFYLDDTLDYVFKIEKLLDDIKKEPKPSGKEDKDESPE
jgi:ribosome-binding factor A